MNAAVPPELDPFGDSPAKDPSRSLTHAIQWVAGREGLDVDFDDLHAALGLSQLVCAVPAEPNLARWSAFARDGFLLEAARLFGLTLRPLHPPEASLGLSGAPEYRQHFDASYRPLVLRALEHDQRVLAWQGWACEHGMSWGVIRRPCEEGIGFEGVLAGQSASSGKTAPAVNRSGEITAVLEKPPVQLYIVEETTLREPVPDGLVELAVKHAQQGMDNAIAGRFHMVTGPAAYEVWIDRLRINYGANRGETNLPRMDEIYDDPSDDPSTANVVSGHLVLANSIIMGYESAFRFYRRHAAKTPAEMRSMIEAWMRSGQDVVTALREFVHVSAEEKALNTPTGLAELSGCLVRAKNATTEMAKTVEAQTQT